MTLLDELRALADEWDSACECRALGDRWIGCRQCLGAEDLRAIIARHESESADTDQLEDALRRATSQLAARVDRRERRPPDELVDALQDRGGMPASGRLLHSAPILPRRPDPHAAAVALLRRATMRGIGWRCWDTPIGRLAREGALSWWELRVVDEFARWPVERHISGDTARRLLKAFGEEE